MNHCVYAYPKHDCDRQNYSAQQSTCETFFLTTKRQELLFVSFSLEKVLLQQSFCNPKIPELGHRQSRDSGLVKMAGILGLQTLRTALKL